MRFLSIDIMRGFAIVLMIQVHFAENLSARDDTHPWLSGTSALLGLIAAPFFTFVSGVSYRLWLRKQEEASRKDTEITKITVRRGLFLFGAGIAFNVLVWLPEDTFNWDVLTLIGTSLMLLAYARKLPPGALVVMCVMVVLLSPLLRVVGDYSSYWHDQTYSYEFTLTDVWLGFIANGFFPLFPWIAFPIAGFVIGDMIFPEERGPVGIPWWIPLTGISLMVLSLLLVVFRLRLPDVIGAHFVTGFTMFPASTEYTIGMLGLGITCLAILRRCVDQNNRFVETGWLLSCLRRYSAFSLTIYIVHHVAHLWPLWIYGTSMEDDPTYYWRKAMSVPAALGLAAVFVVVCHALLILMERHGKYGIESLMRWICE